MYPAGNLFIPVGHGRLEAILKEPRQSSSKGVALVLHPHPLGGGTMHNKVVFRAAAALNDAGLTVLRINFRGVGQSTGTHDEGRGEVDDVRAGLDYLSSKYPGQRITLCGFSFGARVGLEVAIHDPRVAFLIGIGTPLDKYDFNFLSALPFEVLAAVFAERKARGEKIPLVGTHRASGRPGYLPKLLSTLGDRIAREIVQQFLPAVCAAGNDGILINRADWLGSFGVLLAEDR